MDATIGSLIADSQEVLQESQDVEGEAPPQHACMPPANNGQKPASGLWPLPATCSISRTAGGIADIQWVGCPQEPPEGSGLQATELRRFYAGFRKVRATSRPEDFYMIICAQLHMGARCMGKA